MELAKNIFRSLYIGDKENFMRLHQISNINFGYNKALNDRVNKRLSLQNGIVEQDNHLLEMNKLCMDVEDKLRFAEKKHAPSELIAYYSNVLNSLKPVIAEEIADRYPDMDYRKKEIETYNKEIERKEIDNEQHWLVMLRNCLDLDEAMLNPKSSDIEDDEISENEESKENDAIPQEQKVETQKPAVAGPAKIPGAEFVEEFKPNIYSPRGFSSIGGLEDLKQFFEDEIIEPITNPEMAKADEVEYAKFLPRGVFLYGPPGCGKTSIVEALSQEANLRLFKLKISKAGSQFVNGSSLNLQKAFDYVAKVAEDDSKPVILFLDEMESMTPNRRDREVGKEDLKMVSTLLQLIEGARARNIIVIGATNCYDRVDETIRARFDYEKYIGLPDKDVREQVLKIHLNMRTKGQPLSMNKENLSRVVDMTEGFPNRALAILTDKAGRIARKDGRRVIIAEDYVKPIEENECKKVEEKDYQSAKKRKPIGFQKL